MDSTYKYYFPPRPTEAITVGMLPVYNRLNWQAQVKKNGDCAVVAFHLATKRVEVRNRHEEEFTRWQAPTPDFWEPMWELIRAISPGDGWWYLEGELLHNKTPTVKNTFYWFDILVADDQPLWGMKWTERQNILRSIFPESMSDEKNSHWVYTEKFWLAKNHTTPFRALFESLVDIEDEGLVMKNPNFSLAPCYRDGLNQGQVKCRRPTKNYGF